MSVDLLREPTHKVLKKMALPISLGMLSTILFQVVDTYFVGTLGPEELTALGFASTLYFMLIGLYIGFSIGVSVIIGSFFGQDDLASVKRTSSIALLLSFVLSAVLSFVGFISLSHIYAFLGATPAQLVHISAYMKPVFAGLPFLSVAVAASGILRASGNVLFPEVVYGIAGVINVVLDYAFIFGKFGLPALGITGVAYGTVISWIFLLICMMVQFIRLQYFGNFITNWSHSIHITKLIFKLASPAVVTQLVGPFTLMFITYLLGNANTDAVAAFGVAGRIETLVMIGIMAVSTASTPFIAQNLGAIKPERIDQAIVFGGKSATYLGIILMVLLMLFIRPIASLFSNENSIIDYTATYFYVVSISYVLYGLYLITAAIFNGLKKPAISMKIMLVKTLVFTVPLCTLGSFYGVNHIFIGLALSNVLGGLYAAREMRKDLRASGSTLVGTNPIKDMFKDIKTAFGH